MNATRKGKDTASHKHYGMKKEDQLAHYLYRRGADVQLSPGSEGAADLVASWSTGTTWGIQVKASRKGEPRMPRTRDLGGSSNYLRGSGDACCGRYVGQRRGIHLGTNRRFDKPAVDPIRPEINDPALNLGFAGAGGRTRRI